MSRTLHGADYMVMSRDSKTQWSNHAVILPADSLEDAQNLADHLLNVGATEVVMFRWKKDGWIAIPFRR
jgi:hypothetical protein